MREQTSKEWGARRSSARVVTTALMVAIVAMPPAAAYARTIKACTQTAKALFGACRAEMADDELVGTAICINVSGDVQRRQCLDAVKAEKADKKDTCAQQRDLRLGACALLGDGRYDPDMSPALFDDPKHPSNPNPYFPMTVGDTWEYRGGDEVNTIEVLNATKLIAGVTCLVFEDLVFKAGPLHESTHDWFCQRTNGDVWYFGEETADFETFPGDDPQDPEQVSFDGSFKSGRSGDKGGLFFLKSPTVGAAYYEEFSLANAEDVTQVLATDYVFGTNADLDQGVPQALAARFCAAAGDCVVTKNYSLLEPGQFAHKYYAKGVGVILEVEFEDDQVSATSQLTKCNFDARCQNLPFP